MIFRREKKVESFFQDEQLDKQFDAMMNWVKGLGRRDYNKLKKAMDLDYDAYQILHGIEPEDINELANNFKLIEEDK